MRHLFITLLVAVLMFIAGCNVLSEPPGVTPTVNTSPITATDSPTVIPTTEATITPTLLPSPYPNSAVVSIPSPTHTPAPPSDTPVPTATPGPHVHLIAEGETLIEIIFQYYPSGYDQNHLFGEIVRINPNMANPDILPAIGSEILIPRESPTPVPAGSELTATTRAGLGLGETLPVDASVDCYTVQEGDTIVEIAVENNTTIEIISMLNRELNWFGCNFREPSGGPECNPNIRVGQCIQIPQPTPVPTATATPSGDETATPVPTYAPPHPVAPANDSLQQSNTLSLYWASTTLLTSDEVYLVEVQDLTAETSWIQVTRETAIQLPENLIPSDGQLHTIQWRVTIARPNADNVFEIVSGSGDWRTFQWQS